MNIVNKIGYLKDYCFQNPGCSYFKPQNQTDPVAALGEANIIQGVVEDYTQGDLVEEVI